MNEETEKELQDLIHKIEVMMSISTEHVGTGIVCKMSDEDKKTLVDFVAMCLDFRALYIKEKKKNERLIDRTIKYDNTLEHLQRDTIRKDILEEYLKEAQEKYEVYKRESKDNENLKPQMWLHKGEVNMLEIILDKPRKLVTLD